MKKTYVFKKISDKSHATISVVVDESVSLGQGSQKRVYATIDGKYAVAVYYANPFVIRKNADADYNRLLEIFRRINGYEARYSTFMCMPLGVWRGTEGEVAYLMPLIPKRFCKFSVDELEDPFGSAHVFLGSGADRLHNGDFLKHLRICRQLAMAVKKLHSLGLVHTDLSGNNVKIDLDDEGVYLIDIDGCLPAGSFGMQLKTLATPGFIPPDKYRQSVIECQKVRQDIPFDDYQVAVHIYSLLLHRHPLKGPERKDLIKSWEKNLSRQGKSINECGITDDTLYLSLDPVYVENEVNAKKIKFDCIVSRWYWLWQRIVEKDQPQVYAKIGRVIPKWYDWNHFSVRKVCGPYLAPLFDKVFGEGLFNPASRPNMGNWIEAITKTISLLQVCPICYHGGVSHYVYEGTGKAVCPFCSKSAPFAFPFFTFRLFNMVSHSEKENYMTLFDGRIVFEHQVFGDVVEDGMTPKALVVVRRTRDGKWVMENKSVPGIQLLTKNAHYVRGLPIVQSGNSIALENDALYDFGEIGAWRVAVACNFRGI